MTKHITRFLDEPSRAASYDRLFGRSGVLELLQEKDGGNSDRADHAVREYCRSLHQLCNFKYVSQAVIMEPEKDEIRYFLVYATNHHRGIEVFKDAEMKAAHIQTLARHEVQVQKTRQDELMFGDGPSERLFAAELRRRYKTRARAKVINVLLKSEDPLGVRYAELFCAAMAFPLVTPGDLASWLSTFSPHAELILEGSPRRSTPDCDKDDRIIVRNFAGLASIKEIVEG
jgi:hypothetical protein